MTLWVYKPFAQVASYLLMVFSVIVLCLTMMVMKMETILIVEWTMLTLNSTNLVLPIILDKTSCLVSLTVLLISSSVMWFSSTYLSEDLSSDRFTILVLLFVLSMNCLVFIPNLMALLLGWDGLGITSFVLVIYYQNAKSLAAGMITGLTNRVGDVMLIVAIAWLMSEGEWNVLSMHYSSMEVSMAILVASMTKSAQMPFSSWLPSAMAAPTPVSALVHSSTLVTAGVFLLIRFYSVLSVTYWFNLTILMVGTMTTLMAGMVALWETDLKKIIALSTLSQLGLMFLSLGLGFMTLALFHLLTHALFKALLFLCAGTIIHYHQNNQDIRLMGGLSVQLPLTTGILNMANMALCGFPFLAGFYSKDLILELLSNSLLSSLVILLVWVSVGFTVLYSTRLSMVLMWNCYKGLPYTCIHEEEKPLIFPKLILSFGAVFGGAFIYWVLNPMLEVQILSMNYKLLPLVLITVLFVLGVKLSVPFLASLKYYPLIQHSMSTMWFLTPLSSNPLTYGFMKLAKTTQQVSEGGWQETVGGQGMLIVSKYLSMKMQWGQNNPISTMLLMMAVSMVLLFTLL